jgi:hypothetical protein
LLLDGGRGRGTVEWCDAGEPVGGVVAPSLPVVAVLRHGGMDKWLKGGERKMEMLRRGVYARGKEGGEGRTLAASL